MYVHTDKLRNVRIRHSSRNRKLILVETGLTLCCSSALTCITYFNPTALTTRTCERATHNTKIQKLSKTHTYILNKKLVLR